MLVPNPDPCWKMYRGFWFGLRASGKKALLGSGFRDQGGFVEIIA